MVHTEEKKKVIDKVIKKQDHEGKLAIPFGISIDNFYITDFVSENSAIMAKASKVRIKNNIFKEKSIYN